MDKVLAFLELAYSLMKKDAKSVVATVSLGLNLYFIQSFSDVSSDCDDRVKAMDSLYHSRYNSAIEDVAENYSKAIVRCEEEKRIILLDGYRKVDSLQVRYRVLEQKINNYMLQQR